MAVPRVLVSMNLGCVLMNSLCKQNHVFLHINDLRICIFFVELSCNSKLTVTRSGKYFLPLFLLVVT